MLTGAVPFQGENQVSVAMKHVREDLPDIQRRRPEVSATLASVLDRMTEKDLDRRYQDVDTLVADLEEALAIETARTGTSTGEATAVLRTLPVRARRRLPLRLRFPVPLVVFLVVVLVGAGVIAVLVKAGADRTVRGTGSGRIKPEVGTQVVSLAASSAHAYDPLGDDGRALLRRAARRRPRPRHRLEHRVLRRRHDHQGRRLRAARRRALRRRAPRRARHPDDAADAEAGLAGDDLRGARRQARPAVDHRRLEEGRRRPREGQGDALQARHGQHELPLLPRLDHQARAGETNAQISEIALLAPKP